MLRRHRAISKHLVWPGLGTPRIFSAMTVAMRGSRPTTFERVSAATGFAVVLVGLLVLLGWAINVEALKGLLPGLIVMIPNTAIAFALAGASLLLQHRARDDSAAPIPRRVVIGRAFAAVVLAIGALTLIERLTDVDLGIDLLLFASAVRRYPYLPPGRMAVNSAVDFALLGVALLVVRARAEQLRKLGDTLAVMAFVLATLALVGYAYGVRQLYAFDVAAGMALLTALNFTLLSVGVLASLPADGIARFLRGDDAGAVLTRRLLPAAILSPLLLGGLWLAGRRAELFGAETGVALFVMAAGAAITVLVMRSARELRAADTLREALLERERRARGEADVARNAAEEANRTKGEFLAVMSHELRTPLNAIRGYVQLIDMGLRGPITDLQRVDLARIQRAERHLAGLIDDVLDFARLEAGRVALVIQSLRIDQAVDAALALVMPLLEKSLSFARPMEPAGLTARADPERLQQILVNLLSNAIKFTAGGGHISITWVRDGDAVRIAVADTGRGIAPESLEEIFEAFVQIDRPLTRGHQGVGLGLAISRTLARSMGGNITVESALGVGSTFTLALPA